jgi:DNA transposition AAA+ family ATPase
MTKVNGRPINQYTLDGTFIKSHISILKAAESIGISRNSIAGVLSGKYNTAKGYLWKYVTSGIY